MARLATQKLLKKYGEFKSYGELAQRIISANHNRVATKVTKLSNDIFTKERERVRDKEKVVNLPDLSSVLPRHIDSIKSMDRGKMMSDNLKAKITKDLRDILRKPEYQYTRGKLASTLKEQAVKDMQDSIRKTFENYTKIDPSIGVPANIRNIAVTEVRSAVNNTKDAYMDSLLEKNQDLYISKTWIHNGRMSKKPRMEHRELNGVTVEKSKSFIIHNKDTGKTFRAMYPHDPNLPAEESIGCSCEVVYRVQRKSKAQQWNYNEGD